MEKICVLIPNYNKEKYIDTTFESIFKQSDIDVLKVIVCDDASTDNSVNIINKWILKYPSKIKLLINETNTKLLYTIIKLYHQIDTEYFTVLDSDDYWIDNNFIKEGIDYLEKNKQFYIYGTNTLIKYFKNNIQIDSRNYFNIKDQIIFDGSNNDFLPHTSSTIFRNKFSKEILAKLENVVNTDYGRVFRGDSFRSLFHLSDGELGFCDFKKVSGVYNYGINEGIWSSISKEEQNLINFMLFCEIYKFCSFKYYDYYKKKAGAYFNLFKQYNINSSLTEKESYTNTTNVNEVDITKDNINNKIKKYLDIYNIYFIQNKKDIINKYEKNNASPSTSTNPRDDISETAIICQTVDSVSTEPNCNTDITS